MKCYFNKQDLESILDYNNKESKVFMPNRIFEDLVKNIPIDLPYRSCEHIAFAYSYVYLISYLYRYAKYRASDDFLFTEKLLKQILGTSANYTRKDYLTKKGGILDKLDYIKKERDIPIGYHLEEYYLEPVFIMSSEYNIPQFKYPPNYKINLPYRAFNEDRDDDCKYPNNGYFYYVENTHLIQIEVFIFCMSKEELGTCGFYLYSFLKQKCDHFPKGFSCKYQDLKELTGLTETKLKETLKALEQYNMIYNSHEPYFLNLPNSKESVEPKANTYRAKPFEEFSEEKQEVVRGNIIYLEGEERSEDRTDN